LGKLIRDLAIHPEKYAKNQNENMRRNGERVWIAWTNKPVYDKSGRLTEVLCIGNDVTELKEAQQEILRAKDLAESADRLKSAFLASMSHELRTPLNSIIGFTGILLQGLAGPLNEEQATQMGMVQKSARHLLQLINDVLDISKIEAGQLKLSIEPYDLCESFRSVLQIIQPMAEKKGLKLIVDIDTEGCQMVSDRRRVEQVLINLVNNAIKFTDKGEVRIKSRVDKMQLVTSVSDTGIGISAENIPTLFSMFRQIDSGVTRSYEGTGLGLSICKRLVEILGGEIWAMSDGEQKGSTFTFIIPIAARATV
jgi:signal transduction histidine kinase